MNVATFGATFARLTQKSKKDFSNFSIYPTLGIESTLPRYRPDNSCRAVEPAQEQYSVWYFFYGTLTQSSILFRQLGFADQYIPVLYPAAISEGKIEMWAGKYRALVDAPEASIVQGSAYQVLSKEHEDALRTYKTESYEVVRCAISFSDGRVGEHREVKGCTFRLWDRLMRSRHKMQRQYWS